MKVSYNWLNTFFKAGELPPVAEVEQKLIFHAYEIESVEKVGDDFVLDVDVLPNRSSDSLSHRGIAREIATQFSLELANDPFREDIVLEPISEKIFLDIESEEVCPVHTLALIEGVTVKESPLWLKERLEALGQRSINNVVDATNYIMYGLGQPSHVFDFDKLTEDNGVRGIHVRHAHPGEELTLLGDAKVTLTGEMSVLADAQDDTPLDVAGVKGGTHAELSENTTNILITCAKFNPAITRKTAQELKLRTDASARYENEVPDQLPRIAMHEVVRLILDIAGGKLDGYMVYDTTKKEDTTVRINVMRVAQYLGVEIPENEIMHIFTRLGFDYKKVEDDFIVTIPFERLDINIEEELIEELGRVYGYANITPVPLPTITEKPPVLQKYAMAQLLRKTLIKHGYTEVMLYSMRNDGEVKLKNSLNTEKEYLREDLASGVREALINNERIMPLLGEYDAVKIFEIGNVFTKESEDTHLCIGVNALGKKKKDVRTMKELLHIKEVLDTEFDITLPEPIEGTIECNLSEIIKDKELNIYEQAGVVKDGLQFAPISTYPFINRDIAMWVAEGTDEGVILDIINKHGGELVQRIDKFDEFAKDGRVSLAFHIIFQSMEKTLTDDEVGEVMQKIEKELEKKEGFEVR